MTRNDLTILSQSSLQDYTDCPRRFQLRYLEQLNYPAVESEPALENEKHQLEGQYFHRLVQQHLVGIPAEKLTKLANTPNLQRWWENYLGVDLGLNGCEKYPEFSLSAPLGDHRLTAKYDLVAVKPGDILPVQSPKGEGGKVIIFDWKTYRKRPRDEWLAARMQTRVYRALLVQAAAHLNRGKPFEAEQIEMVYWFADFPNDPAHFPYNAAQFKRDREALTKLAQEITAASDYPKTDDLQKCSFCPYRSYCDRGLRAGDYKDAEAELEAEELFDVNFEQIGEIAF